MRFAPPLAIACMLFAVAAGAADLGYRVVERKPLERSLFVQGLEIDAGALYLSSGNYGTSRLQRYDWPDMRLRDDVPVDARLFAEGVTVLGDQVHQLTWRARVALVYDRATLEGRQWFRLPGQGWGLTNNGRELIYSDGSHRLHFVAPDSYKQLRSVEVLENGKPLRELNELEWIDGKVWANVWRTDRVVIIDPVTGAVEAAIDFSGLLPAPERRADTDVLNGIARDPETGAIWVTGKRWPWLYRVETVPQKVTQPTPQSR